MNRFIGLIFTFATCVLVTAPLTGCGGGGGDESSASTPAPTQTQVPALGLYAVVNGGFTMPMGMVKVANGTIFVVDAYTGLIKKLMPDGTIVNFVGTINQHQGVRGAVDGQGANAALLSPIGIVADSNGNLFVTDEAAGAVRKITPAGYVSTFAGINYDVPDERFDPSAPPELRSTADGLGNAARIGSSRGITIAPSGDLYITDRWDGNVRKISPGGMVTTIAGPTIQGDHVAGLSWGYIDGVGAAARFNLPAGIAIDSKGNLFVADSGNSVIRKITPNFTVTTFAGKAGARGGADGPGNLARFIFPTGIAIDSADNLYVVDSQSYTIRKITPSGVVTTVAGVSGVSKSVLGNLPGAFVDPNWIAFIGDSTFLVSSGNFAVSNYSSSIVKLIAP